MNGYFDFNRLSRYKQNIKRLNEYRYAVIMLFLTILIVAADKSLYMYSKWQNEKNSTIKAKYEQGLYEFERTYISKKGYIEDVENTLAKESEIYECEAVDKIFQKSTDLVRVNKISLDKNGIFVSGECESYCKIPLFIERLRNGNGFGFEVEKISKSGVKRENTCYAFSLKCEFESDAESEKM